MPVRPRPAAQCTSTRWPWPRACSSAGPGQLVTLCYEQLVSALGSALIAAERGDNRRKSQALTRAMSALTALQLGVSDGEGVGAALHQFYEGTRRALLDSVLAFDPARIATIRQDFMEIAAAMARPVQ